MSKVARGGKAPEHEPRVHGSFLLDTISTGKRDLARIGDPFMAKMITAGMVVMVVGVMSVTQVAFAADLLIEMYVNGEGDVVDVRDRTGPLKPAPMPKYSDRGDGLERIPGQSITIAEVVSKGGDPWRSCCPVIGGNISCGDGLLYSWDQAGEFSAKTRVGDKWVESNGGAAHARTLRNPITEKPSRRGLPR